MKPKDTVFGSKAEEAAYTSIKSEWSWRFNLHLSLPFPIVIDYTDAKLTYKQKELLLKTSLDFTLTDKFKNKPIISVEFDGLGSGFSRDGKYHPARDTRETDEFRKLKLDLKLKIAEAAGYPLVVVAYDETKEISRDEHLIVLDGVIGQVLAKKWLLSQGGDMIKMFSKGSENLPEPEKSERILDAVCDAELFTKLLWNPVFRRAADLAEEVVRKQLVTSWRHEYLPGYCGQETVKVRVTTESRGKSYSETVSLRNTNVNDIDVMEIAQSIARYRVFAKVLKDAGFPHPPCTRVTLHEALTKRKS